MYESSLGQDIRELDRRLAVVEEQVKQSSADRLELHADIKEIRKNAQVSAGGAIGTLATVVLYFVEQIVAHGGLKPP